MAYTLIIHNPTLESYIKILFNKDELDSIKNHFYWVPGPEGFVVNIEDHFTDGQLQILRDVCPSVYEDFYKKNEKFYFSDAAYFFSIQDCLELRSLEIRPGAVKSDLYNAVVPVDGRPAFNLRETYKLCWYHEYGLFKLIDDLNSRSWFVDPKRHNFVAKNEEDIPQTLNRLNEEMKLLKRKDYDQNKKFIRVINVYSKETEDLKYRIINEESESSGLCYNVEPYPGDEAIFLRSYKVTQEMASYIADMYFAPIEFDFNQNLYYLETLDADDFTYSYSDLIKNLNTLNK
ncbi:MAG TPA: hypothetical protein VF676_02270 [Flavobacterium sp.]|jgi:hypothetical protein